MYNANSFGQNFIYRRVVFYTRYICYIFKYLTSFDAYCETISGHGVARPYLAGAFLTRNDHVDDDGPALYVMGSLPSLLLLLLFGDHMVHIVISRAGSCHHSSFVFIPCTLPSILYICTVSYTHLTLPTSDLV